MICNFKYSNSMIQGWVGVWATNAVSQALSVEVMLNMLSIGSVQTHNDPLDPPLSAVNTHSKRDN